MRARRTWLLLPLALLLAPVAVANGGGHGHGEGEPLFDSGSIAPGATYSLEMWKEGPLDYHCHPHPWMVATIIVAAADGPPRTLRVNVTDGANYENFTFVPGVLEARVGDTVEWRNNGSMPHTVTSDDPAPADEKDEKDSPSPVALAAVAVVAAALARRRTR